MAKRKRLRRISRISRLKNWMFADVTLAENEQFVKYPVGKVNAAKPNDPEVRRWLISVTNALLGKNSGRVPTKKLSDATGYSASTISSLAEARRIRNKINAKASEGGARLTIQGIPYEIIKNAFEQARTKGILLDLGQVH